MPSVRIIYDVDGWAFHHEACALQKYAPAGFEVSMARTYRGQDIRPALGDTPVDVLFLQMTRRTRSARATLESLGWPTKLVVGSSVGLPRRLTEFFDLYPLADAWIINNHAYWEAVGRLPRTAAIANGVDLEVFSVQQPPALRTPKVLWTGSELQRRIKGYDDLILPLREKLQVLGIPCDFQLVDSFGPNKRTPRQMAEWYNTGTVLVCASESEGTPNPALEAAACGCTVVSTRVGNMPELIRHDVNGYLVDRELGALLAGVQAACQNYVRLSQAMQADIAAWHWAERSKEFFRVFSDVLEKPRLPRARRRRLAKEVTVFVTTVGAPTFQTCLDHLRQQDCTYTLEVIDHVAPMNAAFQRMLDACRTPFYIQVDEDMLLYPHAVRTLYETIAAADPTVALFVAGLYDLHLNRCIEGVKIFRHEVVRRYPLATLDAFEIDQVTRLREDGYTILRTSPREIPAFGKTLGLHGVQWTPESIYERYATLERRRQAYPQQMRWLTPYAGQFLHRYLDDPSEQNFFALMGVIAGRLAAGNEGGRAKDYRAYATLPGFEPLRTFLDEVMGQRAAPEQTAGPLAEAGADRPRSKRGRRRAR